MKEEFVLDPNITYLNHGSFGATPKIILQEQRRWQEKLEREPVQFMTKILPEALKEAREAAAQFLGCAIESTFFVSNATTGVQTIVQQRIQKGMHVVCTSHRYQAVFHALKHACATVGATLTEIEVPFGVFSPSELEAYLIEHIPPDTDFLLIDDISSATAMRFPTQAIAKHCKERNPNMEIMVDGAHAPGHVDICFAHVDYWTGNIHKWCCAPKGCAILYVHPSKQIELHALVISHGYEQGFDIEMSWMGTFDPSPFLCTKAVLALHEQWGGKRFQEKNHALMKAARSRIQEEFPYFTVDESIQDLAMCSFCIPFKEGLYDTLFTKYGIEVVVHPFGEMYLLRISCLSAYNTLDDYEYLIRALKEIGY